MAKVPPSRRNRWRLPSPDAQRPSVVMRKIDLHCYSGTQPWIDFYGPFVEALATYWRREWVAKSEDDVVAEFDAAGVEAVLVAFDIESITGAPPCSNDYIAGMRDRHPSTILQ